MNACSFYGSKNTCTASTLNSLLDTLECQKFTSADIYITPLPLMTPKKTKKKYVFVTYEHST